MPTSLLDGEESLPRRPSTTGGETIVVEPRRAQYRTMRRNRYKSEGPLTGVVGGGRPQVGRATVVLLALGLAAAACGDDDSTIESASTDTSEQGDESGTTDTTVVEQANACPADGCKVRIVSVARAGDELELAFEANFLPGISKNHFHVYWDTYSSKQVSGDSQTRFGIAPGVWAPVSDNPYKTADVVSLEARGASSLICVTAGDRYHNVIDPEVYDCRDVSEFL